jgi:hypothetical protein
MMRSWYFVFPLVAAWGLLWAVDGGAADAPPGFEPLFNGKDLAGWKVLGGKISAWGAEDGLLYTSGAGGGWLMTEKEYADFELRLEYRVPENGNSGVALRAPMKGNPAYDGMEIQILDDYGSEYKNLKPTQYTGSIYDVVPPAARFTKQAGQWNKLHILAQGRLIAIEVNGKKVVSVNLDDYQDRAKPDPEKKLEAHPGLLRTKGHLGLQNHSTRVDFRNIFVKPL